MTHSFPAIHAEVFRTERGTLYLKEPGVVMIAQTATNIKGIRKFLDGFPTELNFSEYLADPHKLPPAEQLSKFAGQLCYMSFGPKRTKNDQVARYLTNIKAERHGSVIEHPNFSFLFYGISRSLTHELVRHRAGFAYSQLSQRYVSGDRLRFVERPEYQQDDTLHEWFLRWIDSAADEYERRTQRLISLQQQGREILSGEARTDLRKKVQQAARSCLSNEVEAPIVVTANVRAWRHFIEMRASSHAEVEIRQLAFRVFLCLREVAPILFDDYSVIDLPDGTKAVDTQYRKV